jgi:hypothetical protein
MNIDFRATLNPARDILSLTVTAPSRYQTETVTRRWASAFIKARRAEVVGELRAKDVALNRRFNALLNELRRVNAELVRIDPATFKGRDLGFHGPNSRAFPDQQPPPLQTPEQQSVRELNLVNERIQLLGLLADVGAEAAHGRIAILGPNVLATVVAQTPAVRVKTSSPSRTAPVLIGWAIGLVVVIGGALFVYRRRSRSTRQVVA